MSDKNIAGKELSEKRWLILAFFVPFVIAWAVFIYRGVYPFGDQQILKSDAWHQYYPFLAELQNKLKSGESLYYTWNNGLGTNFWVLIAYYCSSPLNLLTVLIPQSLLRIAYTVFTAVKIGAAGLFCAIFLRQVFCRNDVSLTVFGSFYAFSAYMMGYYWNIMWLDSVAMLPLVILGTYALVKYGRFKLYVISLALTMLCNYLIGAYVCIFVFFTFFMLCISLKQSGKELLGRFFLIAGCSLTALAMAAIFLVPTYFAVMNTYRAQTYLPALTEHSVGVAELVARLAAVVPPTSLEGAPNLYCGLPCVLLAILYVCAPGIPLRQKLCTLFMLVFLVLSCAMALLESMWNGFRETNMLPGRFSFLFCFMLIVTAYQALPEIERLSGKRLIALIAGAAALTAACFLAYGIKIALLNACALLGYIVLSLLLSSGAMRRRVVLVLLCAAAVGEAGFSAYRGFSNFGFTSYEEYDKDGAELRALQETIEAQDEGFFRMTAIPAHTINDPSLFGYRGVTTFNSLVPSEQMNTMFLMGSSASRGKNRCHYGNLASPFTNALLNLNYLIVKDGRAVDETYLEKIQYPGNMEVYRNEAPLSVGFMAQPSTAGALPKDANAFIRQNALFTNMTGLEEALFEPVERTSSSFEGLQMSVDEDGLDHYVLQGENAQGQVSYTFTMPRSGILYGYIYSLDVHDLVVQCEQDRWEYDTDVPGIFCVGRFEEGQQVCFTWGVQAQELSICAFAGVLNEDAFSRGMQTLSDELLQVESFTDTSLSGTIDVKETGYFFTSIPYEKGWTLYVDGSEREITPYQNAWIAVEALEAGHHTIALSFEPAGLRIGIGTSLAGVVVFAAACLLDDRKKKYR